MAEPCTELQFLDHLIAGVKDATGITAVVKGYPTWNRGQLAPPCVGVLLGPSDNGRSRAIGHAYPIRQQYVVVVFGINEVNKIEMVAAIRNWLRSHQNYEGSRVSYVRGEMHVQLTEQQAEQYAYDIYLDVEV